MLCQIGLFTSRWYGTSFVTQRVPLGLTVSTVVFIIDFDGFHNQSPLLTMVNVNSGLTVNRTKVVTVINLTRDLRWSLFEQPGAGYYVIGLLLYSIRYRIGLQKDWNRQSHVYNSQRRSYGSVIRAITQYSFPVIMDSMFKMII